MAALSSVKGLKLKGVVKGLSLKQGTGNRRMGMENGERGTGNGERGTGNGEREIFKTGNL